MELPLLQAKDKTRSYVELVQTLITPPREAEPPQNAREQREQNYPIVLDRDGLLWLALDCRGV